MKNPWLFYAVYLPTSLSEDYEPEYTWVSRELIAKLCEYWQYVYTEGAITSQELTDILAEIERRSTI